MGLYSKHREISPLKISLAQVQEKFLGIFFREYFPRGFDFTRETIPRNLLNRVYIALLLLLSEVNLPTFDFVAIYMFAYGLWDFVL